MATKKSEQFTLDSLNLKVISADANKLAHVKANAIIEVRSDLAQKIADDLLKDITKGQFIQINSKEAREKRREIKRELLSDLNRIGKPKGLRARCYETANELYFEYEKKKAKKGKSDQPELPIGTKAA